MITIDLAGKVAFVTGSTRGIGRAIAGKLHAAGARVAIVGREESNASAVAAEMGEGTVGIGCDVLDGAQVEQALAKAEKELVPIDVLVNNAGLARVNILLRLNEADWEMVLDAILKGYVEEGLSRADLVAQGFDQAVVNDIVRKVDLNEYKRKQSAPGLKITPLAFGVGRRIPIVQKYVS